MQGVLNEQVRYAPVDSHQSKDTQVTQHTNDTQVLPGGTSSLKGQDAQDHLGMTSPSSY